MLAGLRGGPEYLHPRGGAPLIQLMMIVCLNVEAEEDPLEGEGLLLQFGQVPHGEHIRLEVPADLLDEVLLEGRLIEVLLTDDASVLVEILFDGFEDFGELEDFLFHQFVCLVVEEHFL